MIPVEGKINNNKITSGLNVGGQAAFQHYLDYHGPAHKNFNHDTFDIRVTNSPLNNTGTILHPRTMRVISAKIGYEFI
ncbi:MAG: hypothetical protein WC744_04450 [Patescibacteria group bacterium]|jgi:hypothetical protein